jgi:hypothetical protein
MDVTGQVLEVLSDHPDGIRAGELHSELHTLTGVSESTSKRAVAELIKRGLADRVGWRIWITGSGIDSIEAGASIPARGTPGNARAHASGSRATAPPAHTPPPTPTARPLARIAHTGEHPEAEHRRAARALQEREIGWSARMITEHDVWIPMPAPEPVEATSDPRPAVLGVIGSAVGDALQRMRRANPATNSPR